MRGPWLLRAVGVSVATLRMTCTQSGSVAHTSGSTGCMNRMTSSLKTGNEGRWQAMWPGLVKIFRVLCYLYCEYENNIYHFWNIYSRMIYIFINGCNYRVMEYIQRAMYMGNMKRGYHAKINLYHSSYNKHGDNKNKWINTAKHQKFSWEI